MPVVVETTPSDTLVISEEDVIKLAKEARIGLVEGEAERLSAEMTNQLRNFAPVLLDPALDPELEGIEAEANNPVVIAHPELFSILRPNKVVPWDGDSRELIGPLDGDGYLIVPVGVE